MADRREQRFALIREYIDSLVPSLGGVKRSADLQSLRQLHHEGDYTGMVAEIRRTLNLEVRMRVGLVNSGGPETAPAWVSMPKNMALFGTSAFYNTVVTVYIRKSFIKYASTEELCAAISHEISHIILNGIGHKFREIEKAVDLTAMILGFASVYRAVHINRSGRSLGYLNADEIGYASGLILGWSNGSNGSTSAYKANPPGKYQKILRVVFIVGPVIAIMAAIAAIGYFQTGNSSNIEEPPPVGGDIILSNNQIRYCLSQNIRLGGAGRAIIYYDTGQVYRYNAAIADYNSRCGTFRYEEGSLAVVRQEVEARRWQLDAEGTAFIGR